jgi:hypothetical protein
VRWTALAGGVGCSLLLAYWIYLSVGLWVALGALVALGLVYKLGVGQMFAISASGLCFWYHVAGVWLPIIAGAAWGWLFWVEMRRNQLLRRIDPNRSTSE